MRNVNIVLGTEEEILAAYLSDESQLSISHQQISAPEIKGNIDEAIQGILQLGVDALIIKTGSRGAMIYLPNGSIQTVPGFPVEVVNILGAGDAFGAGFIYGFLKGWDLYKCCRMGNACGAHVVTQLGCANFTPYEKDILEFIESKGGF
jgi:5-dehydro-2-deoxygluconokinase